jgi:hypothetical protein
VKNEKVTGEAVTGGCHCGAIRFEIVSGDIMQTGYCHCSICRRISGAPVNAWVAVPLAALRVSGDAATYRSSAWGHRAFCRACGSQLWFAPDDGDYVTLNATGFDDPEARLLQPTVHIFEADRLRWFQVADTLPRLPGTFPADDSAA